MFTCKAILSVIMFTCRAILSVIMFTCVDIMFTVMFTCKYKASASCSPTGFTARHHVHPCRTCFLQSVLYRSGPHYAVSVLYVLYYVRTMLSVLCPYYALSVLYYVREVREGLHDVVSCAELGCIAYGRSLEAAVFAGLYAGEGVLHHKAVLGIQGYHLRGL